MKSLRFRIFCLAQWCLRLGIYGLITAVIINGLLAPTIFSMADDWGKVIGDGFLNLANFATRKLGLVYTPEDERLEPQNHPIEIRKIIWTKPSFSASMLIFQVGLPKKERIGFVSKVPTLNFCADLCGKVSRSDMSFSLGATFGETRCPPSFSMAGP